MASTVTTVFALAWCVVCLNPVEGQSREPVTLPVTVNLDLSPTRCQNTYACIGEDVGLTNTSIIFQYREIAVVNSTATPLEWRFLDVFRCCDNPLNVNSGHNLSISELGVQFRLLQLEHGGGKCNCWVLRKITIKSSVDITRLQSCYSTHFVTSSEARGYISTAYYFNPSSAIYDGRCPGDSESALISNKGSALHPNCSTMLPRM